MQVAYDAKIIQVTHTASLGLFIDVDRLAHRHSYSAKISNELYYDSNYCGIEMIEIHDLNCELHLRKGKLPCHFFYNATGELYIVTMAMVAPSYYDMGKLRQYLVTESEMGIEGESLL